MERGVEVGWDELVDALRAEGLGDVPVGVWTTADDLAGMMQPVGDGPVPAVTGALEGLGRINEWLAGSAAADLADPAELKTVVAGLAGLDAALSAARLRAMLAAREAGLPEAEGAVSLQAWATQALSVSSATAAREVRLAEGLVDRPDVVDMLQAGSISHDHAAGIVAAAERQAADQEAAARVRMAEEEEARERRRRADQQAQADAESMAERMRLAREAAEREQQLARERAQERAAKAAEEEAARRARQDALVEQAVQGSSPDRVRREATRLRSQDAEALERAAAAQRSRRSVRLWTDRTTGQRVLRADLTDDDYDLLRAGLQACEAPDPKNTPAAELRTPEQRRYDAFLDLVSAGLAAGELPTSRGVKPHVTVTVPAETLTGDADRPGVTSFGTAISPETARRLACDASLTRAVLSPSGMPLDIGRSTRVWTAAQHRAAELLFGGCAFPSGEGEPCGRPMGWTDLHHVTWWRHDGPTDQDNGVPLCRFHHTAVHHDGWTLEWDLPTGTVTIHRRRRGTTVQRTAVFPRDNHNGRPTPGPNDPPGSAHDHDTHDHDDLDHDDLEHDHGAHPGNGPTDGDGRLPI